MGLSVFQTGLTGIARGMMHLSEDAQTIARGYRNDGDKMRETDRNKATGVEPAENSGSVGSVKPSKESTPEEAVIRLREDVREVVVNKKVIDTFDETVGKIIDDQA